MEVCLPTTCHLLGIPCHDLGQSVQASLVCKEEIATKVLAKGSKNWIAQRDLYKYFGDKIVCIVPDHKKADVIIKDKLGGIIVKLPLLAMEAVADIGLYHRPKKFTMVSMVEPMFVMEMHLVCQNGMV